MHSKNLNAKHLFYFFNNLLNSFFKISLGVHIAFKKMLKIRAYCKTPKEK